MEKENNELMENKVKESTGVRDIQDLETEINKINNIIYEYLPPVRGRFERISESVEYSIKAGGKRLRPMLMREVFRSLNSNAYRQKTNDGSNAQISNIIPEEKIYPFMAGIEFIHTYSLVHDDLPAMDDDLLRRGLPTTHAKYGEDFGILAGDALLNLAYEVMLKGALDFDDDRGLRAASLIADRAGINGMVGGQALDVLLTGSAVEKDDLDFIFRLKTGALIEGAFSAGAIIAGANEDVCQMIKRAGELIGLAFQIRDDILDETGDMIVIGKPVGSDKKNEKTTYVTLYGIEKAQRDVEEYSIQAKEILSDLGATPFLQKLIEKMVHRKK